VCGAAQVRAKLVENEGEFGVHERYLGRIRTGMDVCDSKGSRIGSVARIFRYDAGNSDSRVGGGLATARDEILEVKTGLFGLGRRFYMPLGIIQEVAGDSIFLSVETIQDEMRGFEAKPDYLDTLH
jgi:hypothetical protein